jgi:hypothetical protein
MDAIVSSIVRITSHRVQEGWGSKQNKSFSGLSGSLEQTKKEADIPHRQNQTGLHPLPSI